MNMDVMNTFGCTDVFTWVGQMGYVRGQMCILLGG